MQPNTQINNFISCLAVILLTTTIGFNATTYAAATISIGSPLDCDYGKNCFIQNYMDMNTLPGPLDYKCNHASFDTLNGTDIRIIDYVQMHRGVKVLAVASGTVTAIRNTEDDFLFKDFGANMIKNKECGNGVVIDHGNGYESQYCHMAKSSVIVQVGQHVNRGDALGLIGMSGMTEFPHVHLGIRKDHIAIDPFTSLAASNHYSCAANDTTPKQPLWDADTLKKFTYLNAAIINFHVTGKIPNQDSARLGSFREDSIPLNAPVVILWADLIHLNKGDTLNFSITAIATGKIVFATSGTINQDYAQYFVYAGKESAELKLVKGAYNAEITVVRAGKNIAQQVRDFNVVPQI